MSDEKQLATERHATITPLTRGMGLISCHAFEDFHNWNRSSCRTLHRRSPPLGNVQCPNTSRGKPMKSRTLHFERVPLELSIQTYSAMTLPFWSSLRNLSSCGTCSQRLLIFQIVWNRIFNRLTLAVLVVKAELD